MGGDHHIHQRFNVDVFQYDRSVSQLAVVIQQLLNQLLQIAAAVIQDLDNFFLFGRKRPSHFVRQQLRPFAHAGQRRFKLMGDMAKELMTL